MEYNKAFIQDVIQWDIKNWKNALHYWDAAGIDFQDKRAMTFGEREGGLSLWLATKGSSVICTDYNEFPETTAEMHRRYGVDDKIELQRMDITNIDAPDNSVDIVMFKSVIGALGSEERQQAALSELHRILKPGGVLLYAENLASTRFHQWVRKKFTKWSDYWHYITPASSKRLCKQFNSFDFKTYGLTAAFGRSEGQRRFLGGIDVVLSKLVPQSWRYILVGIARK